MARFRQQFLFEHNKKRLLHGVSPLIQDQNLNADAQRLAIELAQQRNTTHSVLRKRVGRGENIALRCSFKGKIVSLLLITFTRESLINKIRIIKDNSPVVRRLDKSYSLDKSLSFGVVRFV